MSPEEIKQTKQKINEINKKVSEKMKNVIGESQAPVVYEKYKTKPVLNLNLVEPVKSRIYGKKTARNKIVVLSDFACGHCIAASNELKARVDENRGLVNLTYVLYPLDRACNPSSKGKLSDYSCISAKLALCAEKQGKVWKAMDFLYENQRIGNTKPFDSASFIKNMQKTLKLSKLNECVSSKWLEERLKKEQEVYKSMDIPGTPFVILKDRQLGNVFKFKKSFGEFIQYYDSKENPKRK